MCQIFNGIATGIWSIAAQLAIMASVTHQEIAVSMAIFGLFGSIGAAIGLAIAGALVRNFLSHFLCFNVIVSCLVICELESLVVPIFLLPFLCCLFPLHVHSH